MTERRRVAVVTGATSGLGEEAAVALGAAGFQVVVVGRDAARGAAVLARITAAGGVGELVSGDLFSIAATRALAETLAARHPQIDVLINNAGGTFQAVETTVDGIERALALNVVAPYVLTEALAGPLERASGRVVHVATGVSPRTTLDRADLDQPTKTAGFGGYARAKLALMTLGQEQAARLGARGITVVTIHPGIIPGTRFGGELPRWFLRLGVWLAWLFRFGSSRAEAAARYVDAATGAYSGGTFLSEGRVAELPPRARDLGLQREVGAWLASRVPAERRSAAG